MSDLDDFLSKLDTLKSQFRNSVTTYDICMEDDDIGMNACRDAAMKMVGTGMALSEFVLVPMIGTLYQFALLGANGDTDSASKTLNEVLDTINENNRDMLARLVAVKKERSGQQ